MNKPITISIVDDQVELRDKIATFLDSMPGLECVSKYAGAQEALNGLPAEKPDVILMDINLDGVSGIECVRQLKPRLPASQVIMLTVFEDTEKIFSALTAGASGYLLKRMPLSKLSEAIHEVMEGGSPMSAPIAREVVRLLQKIPRPAMPTPPFRPANGRCWRAWRRGAPTNSSAVKWAFPSTPCGLISGGFMKSCMSNPERKPWLNFSATCEEAAFSPVDFAEAGLGANGRMATTNRAVDDPVGGASDSHQCPSRISAAAIGAGSMVEFEWLVELRRHAPWRKPSR